MSRAHGQPPGFPWRLPLLGPPQATGLAWGVGGDFVFDRVTENDRYEGEECTVTRDGRLLNSKEAVMAFLAELDAERQAGERDVGGSSDTAGSEPVRRQRST